VLSRALFELFGYLLLLAYATIFYSISFLFADWGYGAFGEAHPYLLALALPVAALVSGAAVLLVIAMTKWLVLCGRFREGTFPLYSLWVWRTELVERLEENLAEPLMLNMLSGTCFKPFFYRCMGAKLGRRPYLENAILTEPDLLTLGDYATIESGGTLQAHLFQDRVRTVQRITIGDSCSVGANSIVLLGSTLEDNAHVLPLSLILRNEGVPAGEWHGSPSVSHELYRSSV